MLITIWLVSTSINSHSYSLLQLLLSTLGVQDTAVKKTNQRGDTVVGKIQGIINN